LDGFKSKLDKLYSENSSLVHSSGLLDRLLLSHLEETVKNNPGISKYDLMKRSGLEPIGFENVLNKLFDEKKIHSHGRKLYPGESKF
jgi:hypothetical protein